MRGVMETQCWYDDVPLSDCSHAGLHKAVINQDAALQAAEAEREQSEIRCRSVGGEFEATLIELINVKSALLAFIDELAGALRGLMTDPWIAESLESARKQDMKGADDIPEYHVDCVRLTKAAMRAKSALARVEAAGQEKVADESHE